MRAAQVIKVEEGFCDLRLQRQDVHHSTVIAKLGAIPKKKKKFHKTELQQNLLIVKLPDIPLRVKT